MVLAKDDLTQSTFINGPLRTGKTLLNIYLTLASKESFIEELEKNFLDNESNANLKKHDAINKNFHLPLK